MDLANEPAFASSGGSSTPRPGTPATPSVPPPAPAATAPAASADASPAPAKAEGSSASASSPRTLPDEAAGGSSPARPEIEEEVNQVVSQLSTWGTSFWGGLRKQSASALEAVKKDVSRTVAQAQDEFQKLQTQTVEVDLKEAPPNKGKAKADGEPGAPPSDFLSKLQATIHSATSAHLPSNLHLSENFATLQKSVSETISAAAHNPNLDPAHIRTALVTNIQKNLQGVNIKQAEKLAEEYLKKSEGLLAEAGEFLKDAVKVVPPEQGAGLALAWDGSDMYSFSTSSETTTANDVLFDRSTEPSRPASFETLRAQRKDALIRRLRSDKELLLVDPGAANETLSRREAYKAFLEAEIEGKGGVDGDELLKAVGEELGPNSKDSEALNATMNALVPSLLTKEVFWSRYFFHKHQIELEEEKRKKVLAVTQQPKEEEDFSWDDAEEEASPKAAAPAQITADPPKSDTASAAAPFSKKASSADSTPTLGAAQDGKFAADHKGPSAVAARAIGSSTSTSPRESEESYDIISDQADHGAKPAAKQDKGSDSDSDWE